MNKQGFIEANRVRLAYVQWGTGVPTIVCAHGLTDAALCWTRTALALVERGHCVLAFDARGHGYSAAPGIGYDAATFAADLRALLAALPIERPLLIGHSMGAHTVTLLGADAGLTRGIVLEDPPWRDAERLFSAEQLALWKEQQRHTNTLTIEEIIAAGADEAAGWNELEIQTWAESGRLAQPEVLDWIHNTYPIDWRGAVQQLAVPTLLITADPARGAIVDAEQAAEARQLNTLLQLAHIPGAGHSIRRDNFAAYLAALDGFSALLGETQGFDVWGARPRPCARCAKRRPSSNTYCTMSHKSRPPACATGLTVGAFCISSATCAIWKMGLWRACAHCSTNSPTRYWPVSTFML
ncbi:alpha/beta hydrolase [Candidatus Gracilibacteria bacterium]|nr:alpha/beta hydrolase [Candidatus Gracilibacteria bacterium]